MFANPLCSDRSARGKCEEIRIFRPFTKWCNLQSCLQFGVIDLPASVIWIGRNDCKLIEHNSSMNKNLRQYFEVFWIYRCTIWSKRDDKVTELALNSLNTRRHPISGCRAWLPLLSADQHDNHSQHVDRRLHIDWIESVTHCHWSVHRSHQRKRITVNSIS